MAQPESKLGGAKGGVSIYIELYTCACARIEWNGCGIERARERGSARPRGREGVRVG